MPKVKCDWTELLYDAGEDTSSWSVEMHIRPAAGSTPAIAKFTSAAGSLLVGQTTDRGANYGVAVNASAVQMTFAPGDYELDLLRIDGGRKADLLDGAIPVLAFILPVTDTGLA